MKEGFSIESSFSRIPRFTLADQVYADIKELILSGRIAPGERLTLRALASAVGTSPMPVRDAVSRLVAEKALDLLPNRTIQVSWPSKERFAEIVLIRCTVEGLAAEMACNRRTEQELAEIQKQADIFQRAADMPERDSVKAMLANREMHFTIYRAAGMPTLLQMIEGLWLQVGPVFWATVGGEIRANAKSGLDAGSRTGDAGREGEPMESPILEMTYRSHAALVEAISARDGQKARQAVTDDIEKAAQIILRSGRLYVGEPLKRY